MLLVDVYDSCQNTDSDGDVKAQARGQVECYGPRLLELRLALLMGIAWWAGQDRRRKE